MCRSSACAIRGSHGPTGPGFEIELAHLTRTIYRATVVGPLRTPMLVTFEIDATGAVNGLRLGRASDVGTPDSDLVYMRQNDLCASE